jgi:hypothetical protein
MKIGSIRGLILEEIVLHLLRMVGYRTVQPGEEGTRTGKSGQEVQGRGEWHQIDAIAAMDHSPAFMYPLRLLVEAKCYKRGAPVKVDVARNAVGVLKDISENFFTYQLAQGGTQQVQVRRFNYHSAVFSTSGYTSGAVRYALAHQIFLIQYERLGLMSAVINGLLDLREGHVTEQVTSGGAVAPQALLRRVVRKMIERKGDWSSIPDEAFSEAGRAHVVEGIIDPLMHIGGSYFGTLQGRWPMHLLSRDPLPPAPFRETDVIACEIREREAGRWSFSPSGIPESDRHRWFRLDFDLPTELLPIIHETRADPAAVANVKQQHFSYIDLAGTIGGVRRQIRLQLDQSWLDQYLSRVRRPGSSG